MTLSAETEALVCAKAAASGKTVDEATREALGETPASPPVRRGRIDRDCR